MPELDDRVGRSDDRGPGGGGYVAGAEHCELCAADRVAEGVAGADFGRVYVRAGGDRGRAGDRVHGKAGGILLGAARGRRDRKLTRVCGGAAISAGAAAGVVWGAVD